MSKSKWKSEEVFKRKVFGMLTAVGSDTKGRIICDCECGNRANFQSGTLLDNNVRCCGCSIGGFGNKNALSVKHFGKLTVLSIKNKALLKCQCACGKELECRARELFLKVKTSCNLCKDDRTEAMKAVDEQVSSNFKKDMLTAYKRDEENTTRASAYCIFKCDCGNTKSFKLGGVEKLKYGSCGCYMPTKVLKPNATTKRALEIRDFVYLTAVEWDGKDARYIKCQCICGTMKSIRSDSLLSGDTTSCGCRLRALTSERFKGKIKADAICRHPLYGVYRAMVARCYSKSNEDYHHYGGRGIEIHSRWISPSRDVSGFVNFSDDMGDSYRVGLELERLDVNGNYSPDNCTWVCRRSQVNNLRRSRLLTYENITLNVTEWGELLGFCSKLLDDRLNHLGWEGDLADILTEPLKDRAYTLLYKGEPRSASYIFEAEGFTKGRRNYSITKYGDSVTALVSEGVEVEVLKPRDKEYFSLQEGIDNLRTKDRSEFENHLLYKIEKQLED